MARALVLDSLSAIRRKAKFLGVVFGVFNLQTHEVGLPTSTVEEGVWQAGFCEEVPQSAADFDALGLQMAASRFISQLLS